MSTGDELFLDSQKSVSSGQTSPTVGEVRSMAVPARSVAGYMKASTGGYHTPPLSIC